MRRCYLVCYDIRDDKRLRRVHRVCKGYGEPWQYSVFFCVLKDIDRVRLIAELESEMKLSEDQAIIIQLGADEEAARAATTVLGESLPEQDKGVVVI
jgi:CRISPR-associated protein Cas2